jgi:hypothetical protein
MRPIADTARTSSGGSHPPRLALTRATPHRIALLLGLGALIVLLSGGGFAALESDTVSTYWGGVWWALSLMTTVGFIGEKPETVAGRVSSTASTSLMHAWPASSKPFPSREGPRRP